MISRKALIPETESPEVFVVDDSSFAHRRRLTLGINQGDTVEVVRGVAENERIVLIGQEGLNENAQVRVVESQADSTGTPARQAAEPRQWPRQGEGKSRGRSKTSNSVQGQ